MAGALGAFPAGSPDALVAGDLRRVTGEVVALEPSWTVPPAV
ncbi:hypothetical protein PV646_33735 [Streptomyces sp. ID05-26A]|nr:hypothetical protein [Streptomyces sp. ID05-26A]